MLNVLSTEFLKLRRSKMLMLSLIASVIPSIVKYLQYVFGENSHNIGWEWFLSSAQEIKVFSMVTTVVLISTFIFSMEYQYNTASYLFTSKVSKFHILIAKLTCLVCLITLINAVSALSQLLFGIVALKTALSMNLFISLIKVTLWYAFSYSLLSVLVSMLAVVIKKFTLSSVLVLSYLMLVFPFHLKNNAYICPLMTPTLVAAKLFHSNDYIFTNYYKDVTINNTFSAAFLIILAAAALSLSLLYYKNSDMY